MHAEATCRLEPIQKKKKRKKKRNSRSILFCKFYSSILSLRTLPHQFGLKKPTLSLPFASKNASRVLCLYLPLRAFLDLHIACEQVGEGEGKGKWELALASHAFEFHPQNPLMAPLVLSCQNLTNQIFPFSLPHPRTPRRAFSQASLHTKRSSISPVKVSQTLTSALLRILFFARPH